MTTTRLQTWTATYFAYGDDAYEALRQARSDAIRDVPNASIDIIACYRQRYRRNRWTVKMERTRATAPSAYMGEI